MAHRIGKLGGKPQILNVTFIVLFVFFLTFIQASRAIANPDPPSIAVAASIGFATLLTLLSVLVAVKEGLRPLAPAAGNRRRRLFLLFVVLGTYLAFFALALVLLRSDSAALLALGSAILLAMAVTWAYWFYDLFKRAGGDSIQLSQREPPD